MTKNSEKSSSDTNSIVIVTSEDQLEKEPNKIEISNLYRREPHKDSMTESQLQVKLADLGNACWTVSIKHITKGCSIFLL